MSDKTHSEQLPINPDYQKVIVLTLPLMNQLKAAIFRNEKDEITRLYYELWPEEKPKEEATPSTELTQEELQESPPISQDERNKAEMALQREGYWYTTSSSKGGFYDALVEERAYRLRAERGRELILKSLRAIMNRLENVEFEYIHPQDRDRLQGAYAIASSALRGDTKK